VLLGAEKQAATSAALAYPEIDFSFVTDEPVIDGWDLPNVHCVNATLSQIPHLAQEVSGPLLPLCVRWVHPVLPEPRNRLGTFNLGRVLSDLSVPFGRHVVSVVNEPEGAGQWIVKGDARHRPDAVITGGAADVMTTDDPNGCGVVFQPYLPAQGTFLVTGYRRDSGAADVAAFKIHAEVHCRENLITAAETVEDAVLTGLSLAMLERLTHCGWFSMKWLAVHDDYRLVSIRPVPMATFQVMRRAGLNPLARPTRVTVARAGHRFIADHWYSSYEVLR
jgi:hypothetical protein